MYLHLFEVVSLSFLNCYLATQLPSRKCVIHSVFTVQCTCGTISKEQIRFKHNFVHCYFTAFPASFCGTGIGWGGYFNHGLRAVVQAQWSQCWRQMSTTRRRAHRQYDRWSWLAPISHVTSSRDHSAVTWCCWAIMCEIGESSCHY